MQERERHEIVSRIVREGDRDRYLAALFAPRVARDHLLVLYALNVELGSIAEQAKEPALGEIRLQWWRDALDKAAAGEMVGHPVVDALGEMLQKRPLSRSRLSALIDARAFDISVKTMPDWPTLKTYLHDTAGALFQLAVEILGGDSEARAPAVRSAGLAYGLTGLMRALPNHTALRRVDLPADLLLRHDLSPERLLAGETNAGLSLLLGGLRREARTGLNDAMRHVGQLSRVERTAFLPLSLVDPYLAALKTVEQDPLHRLARINPLYRLWRLVTWR